MSEKYKFPNKFVSSQFVKYISRDEIKGLIGSLGHTISKKYEGQELIIVGVLKGSMMFMADLIREIKNVKVYVDFMKIESVGRDKENDGTIVITKDIKTNILEKNVLIVEEIVDSGRALLFIKERLALSNPSSIEIITLFDKPYKRAVNIKADLIGKKIDDQFIIGYGMDLENFGRNFEDVYFLKYPN
ncbi:MAG: hypoxanthine phosphoribosyltransferase [Bacteriovoracaceae bacterium]|nr:hypoxanthine phosphoribosyltransferase [Bacteriovoracaceae bacterium]